MTETETRATQTNGARHVLLADDDDAILKVVGAVLEMEGFIVTTCTDGERALALFDAVHPDLAILDVRMPGVDGVTVCRRIRAESAVPILMITGMDDEFDAVRALDAGADDYIRKPVGTGELAARVNAALRRVGSSEPVALVAGPITIDDAEHEVRVHERIVALSPSEFNLISYMARHPNRVLAHGHILSAVWGQGYEDARHVLRVTVSRLRQKLALDAHNGAHIRTVGRVGYILRVEALGAPAALAVEIATNGRIGTAP